MTKSEAAQALGIVCQKGQRLRRKKEAIILYGVKYSDELKEMSRTSSLTGLLKTVVKESGIAETDSYYTELGIGVNLAEYVTLKDDLPFFTDESNA